MSLFRKTGSPYWWYSFTYGGKRYRSSTKERTKQAAGTVEAEVLLGLKNGKPKKPNRSIKLKDFAVRFFEWAENSQKLKENSRRFYIYGWRLLKFTRLPSMSLESITAEVVECTSFTRHVFDRKTKSLTHEVVPCSATYTNQALRTLKAMLGKAEKWHIIDKVPKITALKGNTRDRLIDATSEMKLQQAHHEPMRHSHTRRRREQAWLFLVILQDTGARPDEVFPMRIENIHWNENRIWIPGGKTANAKRFVGMSDRLKQMLSVWCSGREGWVFPSSRAKSGHLTTISKGFQAARARANVDSRIVPYSARHTFGTNMLAATGNMFAVSKSMGHAGVKSMEPYQHPDTSILIEAVNERNKENWHKDWHTEALEREKTQ